MNTKTQRRGLLIVLVGGMCSGKSTMMSHLNAAEGGIRSRFPEHTFHLTRTPGGTLESEPLRDLLLSNKGHTLCPSARLMLAFAALEELTQRLVIPAMQNGEIVILDGYLGDIYADIVAPSDDAETVKLFKSCLNRHIVPDVTCFLDCDPYTAIRRLERALKEVGAYATDEQRSRCHDTHHDIRQYCDDYVQNGLGLITAHGLLNPDPDAVYSDILHHIVPVIAQWENE